MLVEWRRQVDDVSTPTRYVAGDVCVTRRQVAAAASSGWHVSVDDVAVEIAAGVPPRR